MIISLKKKSHLLNGIPSNLLETKHVSRIYRTGFVREFETKYRRFNALDSSNMFPWQQIFMVETCFFTPFMKHR
jgi:hypothetical protein